MTYSMNDARQIEDDGAYRRYVGCSSITFTCYRCVFKSVTIFEITCKLFTEQSEISKLARKRECLSTLKDAYPHLRLCHRHMEYLEVMQNTEDRLFDYLRATSDGSQVGWI